MNYEQVRPSP